MSLLQTALRAFPPGSIVTAAMLRDRVTPDDTSLDQAVDHALRCSTAHGLPQTVFRDRDSCGWWHTHSLAIRLNLAEQALTVLPANYFT